VEDKEYTKQVILESKAQALQSQLAGALERIRELEMMLSDLGGCPCGKCSPRTSEARKGPRSK
jgi:hypothetical protein